MVPLFQAGFAGDLTTIPLATWIACLIAFAGVIVMGFDQADTDVQSLFENMDSFWDQGTSFSGGDSLIILAAVSYSMHVIRLGKYAKFTSPLELAASKATVEAILSIGLLTCLVASMGTDIASSSGFITDMGTEVHSYFTQLSGEVAAGTFPPPDSTKAIFACLWTGWITCAYTIYAQSFGQRRVSPTDANLIYSMQPVFSAFFAWALLGENLGLFGCTGAFLIGFSLWVITTSQRDSRKLSMTKMGYFYSISFSSSSSLGGGGGGGNSPARILFIAPSIPNIIILSDFRMWTNSIPSIFPDFSARALIVSNTSSSVPSFVVLILTLTTVCALSSSRRLLPCDSDAPLAPILNIGFLTCLHAASTPGTSLISDESRRAVVVDVLDAIVGIADVIVFGRTTNASTSDLVNAIKSRT
eukprot:CAMPEP_0197254910 /NCGR_PEP_ID=MMETSP1429-20130617/70296_1 /TAXON_ID=49237 /ORGANISM="Chaetoceros  sp., Strain UNC1202" /LENGTH=414 /DNA_ID=CAMNT_0042718035 /DNA_START=1 /DNA_END=1243 /DNA_ORIENTATION=-